MSSLEREPRDATDSSGRGSAADDDSCSESDNSMPAYNVEGDRVFVARGDRKWRAGNASRGVLSRLGAKIRGGKGEPRVSKGVVEKVEYGDDIPLLPPGVVAYPSDHSLHVPSRTVNALAVMKRGTVFVKCHARSAPRARIIRLSADNSFVEWTSDRKNLKHGWCRLEIKDIVKVTFGQASAAFQNAPRELGAASFSIHFTERAYNQQNLPAGSEKKGLSRMLKRMGKGRRVSKPAGVSYKTLDLIGLDSDGFHVWTSSLPYLVQKVRGWTRVRLRALSLLPVNIPHCAGIPRWYGTLFGDLGVSQMVQVSRLLNIPLSPSPLDDRAKNGGNDATRSGSDAKKEDNDITRSGSDRPKGHAVVDVTEPTTIVATRVKTDVGDRPSGKADLLPAQYNSGRRFQQASKDPLLTCARASGIPPSKEPAQCTGSRVCVEARVSGTLPCLWHQFCADLRQSRKRPESISHDNARTVPESKQVLQYSRGAIGPGGYYMRSLETPTGAQQAHHSVPFTLESCDGSYFAKHLVRYCGMKQVKRMGLFDKSVQRFVHHDLLADKQAMGAACAFSFEHVTEPTVAAERAPGNNTIGTTTSGDRKVIAVGIARISPVPGSPDSSSAAHPSCPWVSRGEWRRSGLDRRAACRFRSPMAVPRLLRADGVTMMVLGSNYAVSGVGVGYFDRFLTPRHGGRQLAKDTRPLQARALLDARSRKVCVVQRLDKSFNDMPDIAPMVVDCSSGKGAEEDASQQPDVTDAENVNDVKRRADEKVSMDTQNGAENGQSSLHQHGLSQTGNPSSAETGPVQGSLSVDINLTEFLHPDTPANCAVATNGPTSHAKDGTFGVSPSQHGNGDCLWRVGPPASVRTTRNIMLDLVERQFFGPDSTLDGDSPSKPQPSDTTNHTASVLAQGGKEAVGSESQREVTSGGSHAQSGTANDGDPEREHSECADSADCGVHNMLQKGRDGQLRVDVAMDAGDPESDGISRVDTTPTPPNSPVGSDDTGHHAQNGRANGTPDDGCQDLKAHFVHAAPHNLHGKFDSFDVLGFMKGKIDNRMYYHLPSLLKVDASLSSGWANGGVNVKYVFLSPCGTHLCYLTAVQNNSFALGRKSRQADVGMRVKLVEDRARIVCIPLASVLRLDCGQIAKPFHTQKVPRRLAGLSFSLVVQASAVRRNVRYPQLFTLRAPTRPAVFDLYEAERSSRNFSLDTKTIAFVAPNLLEFHIWTEGIRALCRTLYRRYVLAWCFRYLPAVPTRACAPEDGQTIRRVYPVNHARLKLTTQEVERADACGLAYDAITGTRRLAQTSGGGGLRGVVGDSGVTCGESDGQTPCVTDADDKPAWANVPSRSARLAYALPRWVMSVRQSYHAGQYMEDMLCDLRHGKLRVSVPSRERSSSA